MRIDDQVVDTRRLRWAVLGAALMLLAVLVLAATRGLSAPWADHQIAFMEVGGTGRPVEIVQHESCTGAIDRCQTCHRGVLRDDLVSADIPPLFRAHPEATRAHLSRSVNCTDCHGGVGRALDAEIAHGMPGSEMDDPLLTQPHVQASCARCHTPGDRPGQERLVSGARLYLALGCGTCHPLTRQGRGGWDFGPDLRTLGRRSLPYLRASIVDPTANFQGSTMPSYQRSFKGHPEALEDLLIFVQSLVLGRESPPCGRRGGSANLVDARCTDCHAGEAGKAGGRTRHRCVYLLERRERLRCSGCHPGAVPGPGRTDGFCPVVTEHRGACSACHESSYTLGADR